MAPIGVYIKDLRERAGMAGFKVYGSTTSTNTLRVVDCLFVKGLDFEFVPIDLGAGEQKTEQFLNNMNPFGQVPVFEDGDLKLFEPRGISKYGRIIQAILTNKIAKS
ncbi:hypothetical protein H6P81_015089 [Aristolochia fimbriata]|uniref:glutathione transferase n=1 Tax=Aristolochia fimbriata TaxID=158543 RepID=A0AAV7E4M1_ARIFI|nr:hypothetical protein H6P81_015089 [Aristolochia fimbriata]